MNLEEIKIYIENHSYLAKNMEPKARVISTEIIEDYIKKQLQGTGQAKCRLCGKEKYGLMVWFFKEKRRICYDCLKQWKLIDGRIVLTHRRHPLVVEKIKNIKDYDCIYNIKDDDLKITMNAKKKPYYKSKDKQEAYIEKVEK